MRHDADQGGHRKPSKNFVNLMTYKNTNRNLNLGGTMGTPINKNVELSDAARR